LPETWKIMVMFLMFLIGGVIVGKVQVVHL